MHEVDLRVYERSELFVMKTIWEETGYIYFSEFDFDFLFKVRFPF